MTGSSPEVARIFLLQIYETFFLWYKSKKTVMVNWVIDDGCQEKLLIAQMFAKLLPELCNIDNAYDSMTLKFQ
jgi:hypothetical protein